jgi:hypothetical protein
MDSNRIAHGSKQRIGLSFSPWQRLAVIDRYALAGLQAAIEVKKKNCRSRLDGAQTSHELLDSWDHRPG